MAEPRINVDFKTFLNFDFSLQNDALPGNVTLKELVESVAAQQIQWLKDSGQHQTKLECQLAWVKCRVKAYNNLNKQNKIVYKNPAKWNLSFQFTFANAFNDKLQKHMLSIKPNKQYYYTRLSTESEVYNKCQRILRHITLRVKCLDLKCNINHEITSKSGTDLFQQFLIQQGEGINRNSNSLYLQSVTPTGDKTIILSMSNGYNDVFKQLLAGLHPQIGKEDARGIST